MQAYLDNSATTRCSEGVRDIVVKVMMEDFGNPSSRHDKGMEAEKYLREARMDIAATLKADEKEIYFTSGGTESDNWALIGTAMANKRAGKHIITTAIEHAAVIQPMIYLQKQGFEVSYIPVDRYGRSFPMRSGKIRSLCPPCMSIMRSGLWSRSKRSGKSSKKKIQRHSGMWMQSRPMESTVFIRKNLALICSRSADISCMDQKELDSFMFETE